ncbi:MAG: SBBP repeat-containing protein [Planctomycetia bacterium]
MKITNRITPFLCIALLGILPSLASGQTLEWIRQVGTDTNDCGTDLAADELGNIYITGWTGGVLGDASIGGDDFFVSKYNPSGTCQWTKQHGISDNDKALAITLDGLGHIYVAGAITETPPGGIETFSNTFLNKLDENGEPIWAVQGTDNGLGICSAMTTDETGNLYVSGMMFYILADAFAAKLDSSGTSLWTASSPRLGMDYANDIALDNLNNVCIAAQTQPASDGDTDILLIKYDNDGDTLWSKRTGTGEDDTSLGIATDASRNIYVTGKTAGNLSNNNAGGADAFVRKYNENGQLLWARQWGTTGEDEGTDIAIDASGNIYLLGTTEGEMAGPNAGGLDVFVRKYDSTGDLAWTKQFGTVGDDTGRRLMVDNLGNIYFTGYTSGNFAGPGTHMGENDIFLAKITEVPESSTIVLVLMGLVALVMVRRKK